MRRRRRRSGAASSRRRASRSRRRRRAARVHRVAHDDVLLVGAPCAAPRCARGVPTRPSAIAAQARSSESSRRPRKPLPLSIASRCATPASPHSAPYASKNAIFSVRSASRMRLALHHRLEARSTGRYARADSARTAATRTSRSASSMRALQRLQRARRSDLASACTASCAQRRRLVRRAPCASDATAAGAFSAPARRIASSATLAAPATAISRTSSAVFAPRVAPRPPRAAGAACVLHLASATEAPWPSAVGRS